MIENNWVFSLCWRRSGHLRFGNWGGLRRGLIFELNLDRQERAAIAMWGPREGPSRQREQHVQRP